MSSKYLKKYFSQGSEFLWHSGDTEKEEMIEIFK